MARREAFHAASAPVALHLQPLVAPHRPIQPTRSRAKGGDGIIAAKHNFSPTTRSKEPR
jgi:hypothetical protein